MTMKKKKKQKKSIYLVSYVYSITHQPSQPCKCFNSQMQLSIHKSTSIRKIVKLIQVKKIFTLNLVQWIYKTMQQVLTDNEKKLNKFFLSSGNKWTKS